MKRALFGERECEKRERKKEKKKDRRFRWPNLQEAFLSFDFRIGKGPETQHKRVQKIAQKA